MTTTRTSSGPSTADESGERIREQAQRIMERGESTPRPARDPVNQPMVNNWVEALDDANPVYTSEEAASASVHGGLVSPPAMAQVWTMGGLHGDRADDDPLHSMMAVLDEAGFTSVVATNSDQTYHRYLRHGEHLSAASSLVDVKGPKKTAAGEGWFVTTRTSWYVADELVAEMRFTVLKFRPPQGGDQQQDSQQRGSRQEPSGQDQREPEGAQQKSSERILPAINRDTAYFWEGAAAGELRIHRCGQCGLLRHPPGPMCPECGATKPTYLVSHGLGDVHSFVVHHHPPLPGKQLPLVVALVEIDEGVRMLGEMPDVAPSEVHIGQRVRVAFEKVDEQIGMPYWKPA